MIELATVNQRFISPSLCCRNFVVTKKIPGKVRFFFSQTTYPLHLLFALWLVQLYYKYVYIHTWFLFTSLVKREVSCGHVLLFTFGQQCSSCFRARLWYKKRKCIVYVVWVKTPRPPGRCSLVWFLFNTYCIFPSMHLGSGNFKRVIYNFSITLEKKRKTRAWVNFVRIRSTGGFRDYFLSYTFRQWLSQIIIKRAGIPEESLNTLGTDCLLRSGNIRLLAILQPFSIHED